MHRNPASCRPRPDHPARRRLAAVALVLLLLGAAGCQERLDEYPAAELGDGRPEFPHPLVERDLDAVREAGVVRVITRYGSASYFIHKGGQAGFDYELVSRWARDRGLTVEVIIPEPGENAISLLNSGRGDIVCLALTPHQGLDRFAARTRPTNFVQKVVVLPAADPRPDRLRDLAGLTLTVPQGDPFREELLEIRRRSGVRFRLSTGRPQAGAEELIAQVSRGELDAVVVNDTAARAAMAYLPDLRLGAVLGERRPTVWLVRENCPDLKADLNDYLKQHLQVTLEGRTRRSQTYGIIYDRYFENAKTIQGFRQAAHRPDKSGRISRFDELIRNRSEAAGLDWRLVAALIYQESRFFPGARSKADARGLMQVLPQFAGPQADSLFVPEANLRAGLRLMQATFQSYAYLDSLDRLRFTLAEYHAGSGHVADARRLAMDLGRDPNRWQGALAVTLPRLAQRRYYEQMRHGFYRGSETVDYVEEILNRYRMYRRLVPREPAPPPPHHLFGPPLDGGPPDVFLAPEPGRDPPPPD